jgi:adenine-specific DNA-methyltransferase
MARIDDLVSQVSDKLLRQRLETALTEMKRRQRFGLVFEEHIPETTALLGLQIQVGSTVQRRSDGEADQLYVVKAICVDGQASLEPEGGGAIESADTNDLLVVKRFGDPIFPTLTSVGAIRRSALTEPHHAVINGENFHALQLLVYLYEGAVDCIYIDPPYNTGARDWMYNNRYVDSKDSWRHSKWLSMMEKRLRLAKRLLKSDGVLICMIDEHEANHLGMLLEKIFPQYQHYMITMVINPKGREKANFAPVEEYAFFVVPNSEYDIIARAPFTSPDESEPPADSLENDNGVEGGIEEQATASPKADDAIEMPEEWEIRHARRRGGGAESSSYREKRHNQFYPIYIDEEFKTVVRAGDSIPLGAKPRFRRVGGLRPIWPIDTEGRHRCWAFIPSSMQKMIDEGNVFLGRYHKKRDDWTINYRVPKKTTRKLKTVWWEKSHDAGTHGTQLLKNILGVQGLFPFPKSVYAVRDCLAAVVRNRPNALVLDFFAGSGTTFHATCLLNAELGGSRRSILVTNNEVDEKTARQLEKEGLFRGDREFEKHGIFEQATRPRCKAVLTGKRPDGKRIAGSHIGGRPFADGFEENLEFFRLDYLDPDDVDLGNQFEAIFPSLWLAAGGIADRPNIASDEDMLLPPAAPYAVLFREDRFRKFSRAIENRADVTHVWLVTDSEDAFAEMRAALPSRLVTSMLYRDYLRNFTINTRNNL